MRWILFVAMVAMVLLLSQPRGQTSSQVPRDPRRPAAPAATIQGRVVAADTGQPIRWARVTAQAADVRMLATSTDAEGRFQFDGLTPGRYIVFASKAGFVGMAHGARAFGQPPAPLVLEAGDVGQAEFVLPRGAAVEGRITTSDGEPVQNVSVQATRLVYTTSIPRTAIAGRAARTDDRGVFRLHSLPAGSYFIQVAPVIAPPPSDDGEMIQRPRAFATTYYPGTARFNDAQRVMVGAGQTKSIDFPLSDAPLATVTFRIRDSVGRVPARAGASLQYARGVMVGSQPLPEGRAESSFQRIPPGDFWLYVCATATEGSQPEFALMEVRVSGQDVEALNVRTAPGTTIAGRVEVEEGAPPITPTGMAIVAYHTMLPSLTGDPNLASTPARAGADGRFEFRSLFGPRVFRMPRLSTPWALKAVLFDGRDISDTEVDFRADTSPHMLRLMVTNQTGAISGTVAPAKGRSGTDTRVVIFATDEERWGPQSRHIKVALAGSGGDFSIDGLLPGTYFAAAVDSIEEGSWNDRDVLRTLRGTAERVTVKALATATVRLTAEAR